MFFGRSFENRIKRAILKRVGRRHSKIMYAAIRFDGVVATFSAFSVTGVPKIQQIWHDQKIRKTLEDYIDSNLEEPTWNRFIWLKDGDDITIKFETMSKSESELGVSEIAVLLHDRYFPGMELEPATFN